MYEYWGERYIFFRLDVASTLPSYFFDYPIHEIYHLACPASPPRYQKDPLKTIETCIDGTRNILRLCLFHKCKMLFSSTSEVYGDPVITPQSESYWGYVNPIGIRSCYDESKRMCETIIYEFRKKWMVDIKIIRIFNTYGPRMDLEDGRVLTNFIHSSIGDDPITIYGDGSQTRSFCYISDLIEGMIKMMDSSEAGPINLGNPFCEYSILAIAELIKEVSGKDIKMEYLPLPSDDPKQRCPDIELAKTKLDWIPKVDFKEGIKKMFSYYYSQ